MSACRSVAGLPWYHQTQFLPLPRDRSPELFAAQLQHDQLGGFGQSVCIRPVTKSIRKTLPDDGGCLRRAESCNRFASHSRAALSAIASRTGWIFVGELAMTPKISLVAVCCSKDSLSSLNRRTFSSAITA